MKTCIRLFILSLILPAFYSTGLAQSVSITAISPESPARLSLNEDVTIDFTYAINEPGGVHIYIRPITSGRLTPNYSASGSPLYSSGRGRGTARFTITEGSATVDQVRVQVHSAQQRRLLFQFFVPVKYAFSSSLTYLRVSPKMITIPQPKVLKVVPEELKEGIPQDTTIKDDEIVKKTVKPDGTIEIYYADGTVMGIISQDERYYINPATGDTSFTTLLYSDVQSAHQPADPPGLAANSPATVNEEWLTNLNAWMEYLGYQLLNRINLYLEEEAFKNYQKFEESNSSTIYEKVNIRYTFLEKLLISDL